MIDKRQIHPAGSVNILLQIYSQLLSKKNNLASSSLENIKDLHINQLTTLMLPNRLISGTTNTPNLQCNSLLSNPSKICKAKLKMTKAKCVNVNSNFSYYQLAAFHWARFATSS